MSDNPYSEIDSIDFRLSIPLIAYSVGTVTSFSTSSALSPLGSVSTSVIGWTGSG